MNITKRLMKETITSLEINLNEEIFDGQSQVANKPIRELKAQLNADFSSDVVGPNLTKS